ncbi:MAG: hypothetical protein KAV87_47980, partial [Desulfobacteraceae bacterium]|nr:hypothetical protein [Desulfobacteraceae bacterium]
DDLWLPEKLELQVEFFKKHPEVGLVHARQSYINENGESLTGRGKWLKGISGECFEELFRENCIAVLTVVFKRECLNKIELFNERLAGVDDYEMWLKISKLYPLGYVDQILAKYRMHSSNAHRHYLKMGLMELDAINSILSVFPNLSNDIGKETVTSRLFELYHKTGKLYLWINRDFKNANRYFWKASKKRPFHLENIKYLIWYSMNASKRKTLSWYWYKIRKNFV